MAERESEKQLDVANAMVWAVVALDWFRLGELESIATLALASLCENGDQVQAESILAGTKMAVEQEMELQSTNDAAQIAKAMLESLTTNELRVVASALFTYMIEQRLQDTLEFMVELAKK